MKDKNAPRIDKIALSITRWIGSSGSIILHTILFIALFSLPILGFDFETVLLAITTAVSLEAIYLAIFIQMTVNRNTESLEEVEEDIDEIQEEIDEIMEDEEADEMKDEATRASLDSIQNQLTNILLDIEKMRDKR